MSQCPVADNDLKLQPRVLDGKKTEDWASPHALGYLEVRFMKNEI